jgi:phosphoribosylformimino-5-aminoimidazole carboxamide ribonucleotide (ProFAR) isomerase
MTDSLPAHGTAGAWRVNVDVRDGAVLGRPGISLDQLTDELLARNVPLAIIDLDRTIAGAHDSALLERAVRRHPGRLWVGGRLHPDSPVTCGLLDSGAAGVIFGPSSLTTAGQLSQTALTALAKLPDPSRAMISIDVLGERVVASGFNTPTAVTSDDALDAVVQATAGQCAVLYTDAAAALRRQGPNWRKMKLLVASYPAVPMWYAGGLASWADVIRAWQLGLGAVIGRAYLTAPLGLSGREPDPSETSEVWALPDKGQIRG